jgi:hypothetical protein
MPAGGGGTHACAEDEYSSGWGAHACEEGTHVYGGRGCAGLREGRACLQRGAHACEEDAHWDREGAYRARMGVGRVRTVVRGHVGVVEGAQRGKASRCKRNFLFTYPPSKYNIL